MFSALGRPFSNAGYELARTPLNLAKTIANPSKLFNGIAAIANQAVNNPEQFVASIESSAEHYYSNHTSQEIAEDALQEVVATLAIGGIGRVAVEAERVAVASGKIPLEAAENAVEFARNNTLFIRPKLTNQSLNLYTSTLVDIPVKALGDLIKRTVRVTTATPEMQAKFRSMDYVDTFSIK